LNILTQILSRAIHRYRDHINGKNLAFISIALLITLSFFPSLVVYGQPVVTDPIPQPAPAFQYHINSATGVPDFISFGSNGLKIEESSSGDPVRVALGFFSRYPLIFGTGDVPNQLQVDSVQTDVINMKHVVLQQIYGGVPVFGAELRVHIRPDMSISSISGNYVRDPQVPVIPTISVENAQDDAVRTIAKMIIGLPEDEDLIYSEEEPDDVTVDDTGPSRPIIPPRLRLLLATMNQIEGDVTSIENPPRPIILPGKLSKLPDANNHLTYQFTSPLLDVFVSATTGSTVFSIPNRHPADRLIYDAIQNDPSNFDPFSFELIMQNGRIVSSMAANPEVQVSDSLLLEVLGFYAKNGRTSYDNSNSQVELYTNSAIKSQKKNICPNAGWSSLWKEMYFCRGNVVDDVVGHEFTHGVTQTTADLVYLDESGALNEHYSDVMGAIIFRDNWLIGEKLPPEMRGTCTNAQPPVCPIAIRDIENPGNPGLLNNPPHPGIYFDYRQRPVECRAVILPPGCDNGNVHSNSGIGNRAAVLLSDGDGSAHPGIGRERLGFLFLNTLVTRMHPWSTYIDERLNTWQTAVDLAKMGRTITDPASGNQVNFNTVADEVSWAFSQVGVDARLISGSFEVPNSIFPGRGSVTFFEGQTMEGGAAVPSVRLIVTAVDSNGVPYWTGTDLVDAPGDDARVTFPGLGRIFEAVIPPEGHEVGTADKRTTVQFHSSELIQPAPLHAGSTWRINVVIPTVLPPTIERESETKVHSSFILGGRGDDTINAGKIVTGQGCLISNVELLLLDSDYQIRSRTSPGGPDAHFGSTGARIVRANVGTDNAEVQVHWWFDIGSAVRYKLLYSLSGTNCNL
jgi:Zn-dependent metalloprotease